MNGEIQKDAESRGFTGMQARASEAGTVQVWDKGTEREALPKLGHGAELVMMPKLGDKSIDGKVIRFIHSQYQIGINEMQSLGILAAYIYLRGRENVGVSRTEMLDWSGARSRWQRKVSQGIDECIRLGAIEVIPANNGSTIDITHKGKQVLRSYELRFEEVRKDIEARRVINLLKLETARIKRSIPKAGRKAI